MHNDLIRIQTSSLTEHKLMSEPFRGESGHWLFGPVVRAFSQFWFSQFYVYVIIS